jgi:hypothetical protein
MFQTIRIGQSTEKYKEDTVHINRQVEQFLRTNNMTPTKFGRLAVRDPRLVLDMRMGREIRPEMSQKLEYFMDSFSGQDNFSGQFQC